VGAASRGRVEIMETDLWDDGVQVVGEGKEGTGEIPFGGMCILCIRMTVKV
jgi:hypothetical protein